MRIRKRFAALWLILSLLASWQSALEHPIRHVDELGEFVHLHDGHSHEDGSEAGSLCDLLAALTACAAPAQVAFVHFAAEYKPLSYPTSAPRIADAPPFLSQGPPASV